jgi:rhodanese-related sulfurtransferase
MQDILIFIQHHLALTAILVIILGLLMVFEFIKLKQGAQRLSPAFVIQMINHQNAIIVDIRNTDAFSSGHIVDALSIPLAELESQYKKLEKFKAQPIIIVCATGLESLRAASLLQKNGFNTFILAGGMHKWKETEMPLIKD